MEDNRYAKNQEQYLVNVEKSLEVLTDYHCPIYAPDKKGNPVTIGSGVLIDIYGHKFLVSAGHVFDYTETHKVGIKSKNRLVNITGYIIDPKLHPNRAEDKIDLSLLELDEEMKSALSDLNYLTIDNIDYKHVSDAHKINYTFIGFPATKNKLRYNSNRVKAGIFSYSANRVGNNIYEKLGISPNTHIAIKFRKNNLASSGGIINAPDLYAMSGGGIWLNDNFHLHPSVYVPKVKLVGIALSWHKSQGCIMGVSAGAIIEIIKTYYDIPELFSYETNMPSFE